MLLPPFTIMIIKNSRRPVTIRVTYPLAVAVLCILAIAAFLTVSAVQSYVLPSLSVLPDMRGGDRTVTEYILVESSGDTPGETAPVSPSQPEITGLTITTSRDDDIELSFAVANYTGQGELYLWLILNPGADDANRTTVVPRNPLFRGMPVDYRNGIRHLPADNKKLRFTFAEQAAGGGIDALRVLAYSPGGDIVIDRTITIRQNTGM